MKKQGCCMKGQIDLFTWYDREERAEKKLYRKVSKWQSVMPFRLLVFQKAYVALKKSGKIAEPIFWSFDSLQVLKLMRVCI